MPVLLAVLLLAEVFAGVSTIGANNAAAIPAPDSQHYVDAATTMAQALTTIDYRYADRDVQRILDNATGTFYDNFKNRSADFIQVVRDA